jgi:ribosomal protein S12 methylthiotransferase
VDKLRFGIVSLGCDKNRIDSETILGSVQDKFEIVNDPKDAEIILVNTCGFIEASKQESINTIIEMAEYKSKFKCKMLIGTGCLTQRYGKELENLMPELDAILGVNDYKYLNEIINNYLNEGKKQFLCNYSDENINEGKRVISTGKVSAYVRIAEGCNNNCSYCIIPKIRGKYRSRKSEDIILECTSLAKEGVKEIIIVAQDTTKYGVDLYGKKTLPKLLNDISKIDGISWIRLLYCYPEEITDELIAEMASNEKICKYIDMPIQHISNDILKAMRRRTRKEEIKSNIFKMKKEINGLVLRTSLIVGFPGETEENFNEMLDFIKEVRFDKLGVFKYSEEEGTLAAEMENQISGEIKEEREEALMVVQQQI